ncbi:diacylglycerol kinase family protein [Marivita sp. GX14005]|uniref:diacylglycerol/lipid kinase family protein n=1 Tax=Marivita sp. GX14005 TaxID=2942276 RepID=UPI002018C354|nr:diacylglycerol kinase family protein [Marivita sp. GX14005]MCL3883229.1 NAD(+)/NADH kinase [Marivita sp. GX14005]
MDSHTSTGMGAARICVLFNAGSGKQGDDEARAIREAMDDTGLAAEIRVIEKGSQIAPETRRALRGGFEMIVAAGGDGTISAVAGVLRGQGTPLGILPLGTFNYFARSLDIPTEIPGAVRLLADGVRRPVRVGTINDRVFLNNASLGAYPAILKTREDTYARWGRSRLAAYWSVLLTLMRLRRPMRLRITADGTRHDIRTPLVFALNNAFQLDRIGLQGAQEIASGRLALFAAPDHGRWGIIRDALELAMGRAQREVDFKMIAARHITIETQGRVHDVAGDGERTRMQPPFDLKVVEDALQVIVPHDRQGDTR